MPQMGQERLAYIDWLRGLACLVMFEVHCYDSWLSPAARNTTFYGWSRFGGILPAPLFLFLAGVSVALVTDKMRRKGVPANQIAASTIRRGAEIFGLALLFRVQEFALAWPWSPWTDLLRVDVLNTIGLSIVLMGVVCRLTPARASNTILAAAVALGISMAMAPALAAVVHRVLHQWRSQFGQAPIMAVPAIPVGRLRFCRSRGGIHFIQ
jgi:uncharacterized membrane protein